MLSLQAKKIRPLLIFLFACIHATTFSQIMSTGSGKWENASIWSCGCVPGPSDDVVIKHTVEIDNTTGSVIINSIYITNTTANNAILNVKDAVHLTVNTVTIDGTGNNYDTEFNLLNASVVNVSGSVMLTRNQIFSSWVRLRLTNTSKLSIAADLIVNYFDGVTTAESINEVSLGSSSGDAPTLEIGGNLLMIFNSQSQNTLTFLLDNSAYLLVKGDVIQELTGGAPITGGRTQISLRGNSIIDIVGDLYFNHILVAPTADEEILLVMDGNSTVTVTNLNLKSVASTASINNNIKLSTSSSLVVEGDLNLSASSATGSVDNRFEVNDASIVELKGAIINPNQGSFVFQNTGELKLTGNAAQSLPNLKSGTTYKRLTINNTSTTPIILNSPLTLDVSLTMLNGILASSSVNTFTFANGAIATSEGTTSSYITGPVKKMAVRMQMT